MREVAPAGRREPAEVELDPRETPVENRAPHGRKPQRLRVRRAGDVQETVLGRVRRRQGVRHDDRQPSGESGERDERYETEDDHVCTR